MLEALKEIDVDVLLWINHAFKSDWMDDVMIFCSERFTWIPWYAVLLYFLYKSNPKRIWINLILITCCISLADQLSSGLLKPLVARLRPCHNDSVNVKLLLINGVCGGQYGFVSSHAANVFAVFIFFVLKNVFQKMKYMIYVLLVWAIVVSLSRVYLGVHYPGDILCGALVGVFCTYVIVWLEGVIEEKYFNKKST